MAKKRTKKTVTAKGTARRKAAAPRVRLMSADPPYKCATTGEPGVCLRFNRNPRTGQYNLPPRGIRVNCKDCEYFFD